MSTIATGLLTGPELASRIGKSVKTIHRWYVQGVIPSKAITMFGRRPRYSVPRLREAGWEIPDPTPVAVSA